MSIVYLRLRRPYGTDHDVDVFELIRLEESEEFNGAGGELKISVKYVHGPQINRIGNTEMFFGGKFEGYSYKFARVTNGGFFVDALGLEGRGIGTYVMWRIVRWLQHHAPQATVRAVYWRPSDAKPGNIVRRAKVYESIGLVFDKREKNGIPDAAGASQPILVSALIQASASRLIQEVDIEAELNRLADREKRATASLLSIRIANDHLRKKLEQTERIRNWSLAVTGLLVIGIILTGMFFRFQVR